MINATIYYGDKVFRPAGYRVPEWGELYIAKDGHIKQAARPLPKEPRLIVREFDADHDFGAKG